MKRPVRPVAPAPRGPCCPMCCGHQVGRLSGVRTGPSMFPGPGKLCSCLACTSEPLKGESKVKKKTKRVKQQFRSPLLQRPGLQEHPQGEFVQTAGFPRFCSVKTKGTRALSAAAAGGCTRLADPRVRPPSMMEDVLWSVAGWGDFPGQVLPEWEPWGPTHAPFSKISE